MDISDWDEMNTHHLITDLDSPIALTGHILSPFYIRDLNYQDSRFHSIAHLMCYRHAVVAGQKTFATGIRKWSKHLIDYPTHTFKTIDWQQQWRSVLMDIYSHLCLTDVSFKTVLIQSGPRPFTLHCCTTWGDIPNEPDTGLRANVISDILHVHVHLPQQAGWYSRPGLRNATRWFAPALLDKSINLTHAVWSATHAAADQIGVPEYHWLLAAVWFFTWLQLMMYAWKNKYFWLPTKRKRTCDYHHTSKPIEH